MIGRGEYFLALLKEEYSGGEGTLRDMNALIELISIDEYDKIKIEPYLMRIQGL